MPRLHSPERAAERMRKWAEAGFDVAVTDGGLRALGADKLESRARAPRRQGHLARTIRVIRPSSTRSAKTGLVRLGLAAGSRSAVNPVPYASVHQRGVVGYPGQERTRAHVIRPQGEGWLARRRMGGRYVGVLGSGKRMLSFVIGGKRIFTREVNHPGSKFKARNYLQVKVARVRTQIDSSLQQSAGRELG